ncbi:MAG: hypothetical protein KAS77_06715, partial [Thermoplasmata archaeon]|nr:hypothetical protein [Thermoplasmata archaeon]
IYYELGVFDTSGLMDKTTGTVKVSDNDAPNLGTDGSSGSATTGEIAALSMTATDNIGMSEMRAMYRFGTGTTQTVTMTKVGTDRWSHTIYIPGGSLDKLYYRFSAGDAAGNWNTSTEVTIVVLDNDDPVFGADSTDTTATTGDPFTFSVTVDDNIAVQGAWVLYRYGPGLQRNGTLTSANGLLWQLVVTIDHTLRGLAYTFGAEDASGNVNAHWGSSVMISDNDQPTYGTDSTLPTGTTGDPFTISIAINDNIAVGSVSVTYRFGTGTPIDTSMTSLDDIVWKHHLVVPTNSLDDLHYSINAADSSGNLAANAHTGTVDILDNDKPFLDEDLTPTSCTTGETLNFQATSIDNVEVETVHVEYWYVGDTPINLTYHGSNMSMNITVEDTIKKLRYFISIVDTSGNWFTGPEKGIDVIDNDVPAFGEDASSDTADTDMLYTFSISVWDNIEVAEVWVEYRYGDGETTRLNLTSATGSTWEDWMIVADTLDDLHFIFRCNDTSGNENSTIERTVDVIDINGPHIINEGTKSWATTGEPFEFTLTAHDNVGLKSCILWYALDDGELAPVEMEVIEANPPSGNTLYSLWIDVPSDQSMNITYRYEIEDLYGNVFLTHEDI